MEIQFSRTSEAVVTGTALFLFHDNNRFLAVVNGWVSSLSKQINATMTQNSCLQKINSIKGLKQYMWSCTKWKLILQFVVSDLFCTHVVSDLFCTQNPMKTALVEDRLCTVWLDASFVNFGWPLKSQYAIYIVDRQLRYVYLVNHHTSLLLTIAIHYLVIGLSPVCTDSSKAI
jgi:hypothetical protein